MSESAAALSMVVLAWGGTICPNCKVDISEEIVPPGYVRYHDTTMNVNGKDQKICYSISVEDDEKSK